MTIVRFMKNGSLAPLQMKSLFHKIGAQMYASIQYTRANPVLPPVLFSGLSPDRGKLLPTFLNQT